MPFFLPHLASRKWKEVGISGDRPSPRWGHSAVTYNHKMYIFGGFSENYTNELWQFDFGTNFF